MNQSETIASINCYAADNIDFIFVINYAGDDNIVLPLADVNPEEMMYAFGSEHNIPQCLTCDKPDHIRWQIAAESPASYRKRFDTVHRHLCYGNSFLANLTGRIAVNTNLSLLQIFMHAKAKYRLWIKDQLVCFSPETFITIDKGKIRCCPMKGTISADKEGALQLLMNDEKEAAEHATITDLIRNDLSMVAQHVEVERYRYADLLHTNCGKLWQTSSCITGILPDDYIQHLGELIFRELPAGSITGAPKAKTMQIIAQAEPFDRGYYTGVMGIYRQGRIDSAVMIRFIDVEQGQMYFKAGGGITAKSCWEREYQEMIQKVYLPF